MKVHDDQLREIEKTGSPPLKYSPSVLVSTLPESWLISSESGSTVTGRGHMPHVTVMNKLAFLRRRGWDS